jgi:hypothetical protein
METLFLVCAIVGGTLLACQFLLSLLGFGEHHGADGHGFDGGHVHLGDHGGHDAGHGAHGHAHGHGEDQSHQESLTQWFVGMLSFRSLVAALVFFGLAGRASRAGGHDELVALAIATAAGLAALFVVATLMKSLHRLRADGTVHIERAVGLPARVYLTIPGARAGVGKVHVVLQNRTMEYPAVTAQTELPTGSAVVVVSVVGPNTLEVSPAAPGDTSHV